MQQIKLLFVALMLAAPALGCGDSKPKPVTINELTPEQIAEQEALLNEAEASERDRRKNAPKVKTPDELAEESERGRRR